MLLLSSRNPSELNRKRNKGLKICRVNDITIRLSLSLMSNPYLLITPTCHYSLAHVRLGGVHFAGRAGTSHRHMRDSHINKPPPSLRYLLLNCARPWPRWWLHLFTFQHWETSRDSWLGLGSGVIHFAQTKLGCTLTLGSAHLWKLVSEASWQDRPQTSSILRQDALWAIHASCESHCSVMKEKNPALSTGCWCLGKMKSLAHVSHLGAICAMWEQCDLKSKEERQYTARPNGRWITQLCLRSSLHDPLKTLTEQRKHSGGLSDNMLKTDVCEKRIRALLSRPSSLVFGSKS